MLKHDVELYALLYSTEMVIWQHSLDMKTIPTHLHSLIKEITHWEKVKFVARGNRNTASKCIDVKIMDGVAIVHLLPPTGISTIDDYASSAFIPYVTGFDKTQLRRTELR